MKLKITTPTDQEIVMTRVFDAPRVLVFEAMTTPELLRRWFLGPDGWVLAVCEIDLRVGGSYRYVWRRDNAAEIGMSGVFREIVPPERIVNTERFENPWYEGEALITNRFAEQDGKTTLTLTMWLQSKEIRDMVLKTNMEKGVEASYVRLDDILVSLQAQNA